MITKFESLWEDFSIPLRVFIKRRVNNNQDVEEKGKPYVLQEIGRQIVTFANNPSTP